MLQALSAQDRVSPVGTAGVGGPFAVGNTGLYVAAFELVIPGEAVPWPLADLPPGSRVMLDFRLEAREPTCGLASGVMVQPEQFPVEFTSATFALEPATHPDAHLLPVIDCAGTRAEPL